MPVPPKQQKITPTQYFSKGWDGRDCEHAGMDAQCMCDIIKADIMDGVYLQDSNKSIQANQGSPNIIQEAMTSAKINEDEFTWVRNKSHLFELIDKLP